MNDANDKPWPVTGECPSREVLSDLALGKLPMGAIEAIGQHVESCPTCQAILESLDGLEDSVIADLKGHTSPLPPDPQLQEQIREAEQISRVVWHESGRVVRGAAAEATGPVRDPGTDRPGRHGHRLQGHAHPAETAGRHQGASRRSAA